MTLLKNWDNIWLWSLWLACTLVSPPAWALEPGSSAQSCSSKVIVIDPGHGGHKIGAVGPQGHMEKSVTLALANDLKALLSPSFQVLLTREEDYWLDIERRTALANHHRADILVSLHASGGFGHKSHGIGVFCYGPGTSSQWSSIHRGEASKIEKEPRPWGFLQSTHEAASRLLRDIIYKALVRRINSAGRGTVRTAPLLVLRGADMPAIVVEVGYIANPAEEKELGDSAFLHSAALAINKGIRDYFSKTTSCNTEHAMVKRKTGTGRGAAW